MDKNTSELKIVSVSYGCTRPDGNYQSVRLDATVTLLEGQNPDDVFRSLQEYVEQQAENATNGRYRAEVRKLQERKVLLQEQCDLLAKEIEEGKQLVEIFSTEWQKAKNVWEELEAFAQSQGFELKAKFPESRLELPSKFSNDEELLDLLGVTEVVREEEEDKDNQWDQGESDEY